MSFVQKQGEQVVNVNAGPRRVAGAVAQKKLQEKKKPEVIEITETPSASDHGKVQQKAASKKKKSPTLTSFLTARSKEACGLTKKPQELIVNIDEGSLEAVSYTHLTLPTKRIV